MKFHVFTDVDGCLQGGRGRAIDLSAMASLKHFLIEKDISLYLVSGRSQPYLEAINQMLESDLPYVCENGSAVFDSKENHYIYSVGGGLLNDTRQQLIYLTDNNIRFEPGKDFSLSFRIGSTGQYASIAEEFNFINSRIALPENLKFTLSASAIDIISTQAGKGVAVQWLMDKLELEAASVFGFGDAANDLPFVELLGVTGSPSNASADIKEKVDYISAYADIFGLLDFIKKRVA